MTERHTQDGFIVLDHDAVYEIMFQHYNAEHSESYPRAAQCHQIPSYVKIWKMWHICLQECRKINNAHNPQKTVNNPIPENTF